MRQLFLALTVLTSCAASAAADPRGEWRVADGRAHIQTAVCEGRLWGVVSWETQPGIDENNPDPALRKRPTLGLPVILGMAPTSANRWEGEIYNAENGKTYDASVTLKQPNLLEVKGCVLRGWVCSGEDWRRVQTATPAATPQPANDLCLRLVAAPRRSEQGRLK
jgi:uncharacterized protein (DUF2147 family)